MTRVPGTPRVSVVIPVFDMRGFLPAAIESALHQTLSPEDVEIVVIDDGSRDGSGAVAAGYAPRVRCLRQANRGLAAARNAGIGATRAPFVAFLDADDRLLPEKLAAQLAVFDADPTAGIVYCGWYFIDEAGARLPHPALPRDEGDVYARLVLGNLVQPHAPLVRRAAVTLVGGFDERLGTAADWDFWLRLSRTGVRWRAVGRPLVEYRVREGAMHTDVRHMLDERLRVLDKVFADPALPDDVRRQRAAAYQNAWLLTACDHYRAGERAAGAETFRRAVAIRPAVVTETRSIRRLCRWLLPLGYQSETIVVARWREVAAMVRAMLDDLFAQADLPPAIARLRWAARIATARTIARLARKRALVWLRPPPFAIRARP